MNDQVSYVVDRQELTPLHLRDRAPFKLPNTEAVFRYPESDVLTAGGRVQMSGGLEFQTQITPGVLTDVCDPEEFWNPDLRVTHRFRCVYDPEIQRGVKETDGGTKREHLRPSQIESMMKDIVENTFECPQLMWNLRAGETTWVYIRDLRELRIYEGVASRPDTNHRHHAIITVHRKYLKWVRDTGTQAWGHYNPHRSYGLVVYTDDFKGEAHRFYVYNFKGWRVSTSTAHYIESKTQAPQLHTRLARELMENSGILGAQNVELLSSHLSRNSAKMITFGTLVEALKGGFPGLTEDDMDETRDYLLKFLEELHRIRTNEIGLLSVAKRQQVRENSVADQAVLWHAYLRVAKRLKEEAGEGWGERLNALGERHETNGYSGDPLSRRNPAWLQAGVIAPGKTGPRVVNNRQARDGAYEYLCELMGLSQVRGGSSLT